MKYLIVVIALALTACVTPRVTSESTNTIVVKSGRIDKAIPLAEEACNKKGMKSRVVRSTNYTDGNYIFECY